MNNLVDANDLLYTAPPVGGARVFILRMAYPARSFAPIKVSDFEWLKKATPRPSDDFSLPPTEKTDKEPSESSYINKANNTEHHKYNPWFTLECGTSS